MGNLGFFSKQVQLCLLPPTAWSTSSSRIQKKKYVEQCLTIKTPSLEDVFWDQWGHIFKMQDAAKKHCYLLSLQKPSCSSIYHYNSPAAAIFTQELLITNLCALGRFSPLRKLLPAAVYSPPAVWIFPPFQHKGTLWMYLQATMFCIPQSMDLKRNNLEGKSRFRDSTLLSQGIRR